MASALLLVARLAQTSSPTTEPDAMETFLRDHGTAVGAVVMIAAVLAGIGLIWAAQYRNRRVSAMVPTAEKAGLRYAAGDVLGCTQVAFPLFRVGDGRRVENLMWREAANGLEVRVFDFSYYVERKDENGKVHRSWSRFDCAMARHNGLWPMVHITKERALDKVAQSIGLPDIELESEEFNRLFRVQCEDRRFATALLDPQMMDFLLTTEGKLSFETKGRWLLVVAPHLDTPAEMVGLLGVADEFLRRIPAVVWDLYPEGVDTVNGVAAEGVVVDPLLLRPTDAVAAAMGEERRDDWWDPTPGVEHDLDGNPVAPRDENPWG